MKEDIVGEHIDNYDSFLLLSHFKGHAMGGFGGALKNMSIGMASTNGKLNIHSAGTSLNQGMFGHTCQSKMIFWNPWRMHARALSTMSARTTFSISMWRTSLSIVTAILTLQLQR